MTGVPHLQELTDKFRDKGFEIVAVSSEDAALIQSKMIDGKKPTFGVVKADISKLYETRGIPHSWVLDADGKCIYKGHPSGVTAEKVTEWVASLAPTKVDKELAKELNGAVKAFDKGEYGKSLNETKIVAESATDELVKADADYLMGLLNKHVNLTKNKVEGASAAGDRVAQVKALEEGAAKFKGSEIGGTWDTEAKELKKSKEYKDCNSAATDLEKLRPKLEDMKSANARKELEKIAKKYPETPAGKEAAELAKRYN